jgi:hypothetical protein
MTWIQTHSGVQFWPLEPRAEDVRIEDIAHALSNTCRFTGHCSTFYSVAQHSVLVAKALQDFMHSEGLPCDFRIALLHDAAEAYLPDISRPIKHAITGFDAIENRVLEAIFASVWVRAAGVSIPVGASITDWFAEQGVKHWDDVLLATEARDLLGPPPEPWVKLPSPLPTTITPLCPEDAKDLWLYAWHDK